MAPDGARRLDGFMRPGAKSRVDVSEAFFYETD